MRNICRNFDGSLIQRGMLTVTTGAMGKTVPLECTGRFYLLQAARTLITLTATDWITGGAIFACAGVARIFGTLKRNRQTRAASKAWILGLRGISFGRE
jgi:hypothetical protein